MEWSCRVEFPKIITLMAYARQEILNFAETLVAEVCVLLGPRTSRYLSVELSPENLG